MTDITLHTLSETITATNMTLSTTDCDEPCNTIVTVTWINTGNSTVKFNPAITVNGNKIMLRTEIMLHKNDTTTQTFNLTNLMEGTYNVCPYPN